MRSAPMTLVVEDDDQVQGLLTLFLEGCGLRPVVTSDFAVAVELLSQGRPGLLLADVCLRDGSGESLAETARTLGVPTILMSGQPAAIARLEEGTTAFLQKPFSLIRLEQAICRLLPGFAPVLPGSWQAAAEPTDDRLCRLEARIAEQQSRIACMERTGDSGGLGLERGLLASLLIARRVARDARPTREVLADPTQPASCPTPVEDAPGVTPETGTLRTQA